MYSLVSMIESGRVCGHNEAMDVDNGFAPLFPARRYRTLKTPVSNMNSGQTLPWTRSPLMAVGMSIILRRGVLSLKFEMHAGKTNT